MKAVKSIPKKKNFKPLVLIGALLFVTIIAALIALIISSPAKAPSTDSDDTANSAGWVPFESSEYSFTISFPSHPTTRHQDIIDLDGTVIPQTIYYQKGGKREHYAFICSCPKDHGPERGYSSAFVEAINYAMRGSDYYIGMNTPSDKTEFLGNLSTSGILDITVNREPVIVHYLGFTKDHNCYTLMTTSGVNPLDVDPTGTNQSEFDKFTSSFQFN